MRHLDTFYNMPVHLRAVGEQNPPYYYVEDGAPTGLDVEVFKALAESLNFSYSIYTGSYGFGAINNEGEWTGMVGQLIKKNYDVALGGISVTAQRSQVIQYTFPHMEEPIGIYFRLDTTRSMFFIDAFSIELWILLLLLPVIVSALLITMNYVQQRRLCTMMSPGHLPINSNMTSNYIWKFVDTFFILFGNLFCQGGTPPVCTSPSTSALHIAFWFTMVVMAATFAGNLTATLTTNKAMWPFKTLAEYGDHSGYPLYIKSEAYSHTILKTGGLPAYAQMQKKLVLIGKGLKHTDKNKVWHDVILKGEGAITSDYSAFVDINYKYGCKMTSLPEFLARPGAALALQKNSPWTEKFNKYIHNFLELGMVQNWYKKHAKSCKQTHKLGSQRSLRLEDARLIIAGIIGGGLLLSSTVFALELIIWRCQKWKGKKIIEDARKAKPYLYR